MVRDLQYNNGVPADSRFAAHSDFFKDTLKSLNEEEGLSKIRKVQALSTLAETELGCSVTHLALAWVAKNPNTSTVILGASKPEQVVDNLKALDVIPKLTPEILDKIEAILQNKPAPTVSDGVVILIAKDADRHCPVSLPLAGQHLMPMVDYEDDDFSIGSSIMVRRIDSQTVNLYNR